MLTTTEDASILLFLRTFQVRLSEEKWMAPLMCPRFSLSRHTEFEDFLCLIEGTVFKTLSGTGLIKATVRN